MKYGQYEEVIKEGCAQDGLPVPEHIAKKPEILPGLNLQWEAFRKLRRGRGRVPIPYMEIVTYCQHIGIEGEQEQRVISAVVALDDVYLEHMAQEAGQGGQ